jgi:hypothetical protein
LFCGRVHHPKDPFCIKDSLDRDWIDTATNNQQFNPSPRRRISTKGRQLSDCLLSQILTPKIPPEGCDTNTWLLIYCNCMIFLLLDYIYKEIGHKWVANICPHRVKVGDK